MADRHESQVQQFHMKQVGELAFSPLACKEGEINGEDVLKQCILKENSMATYILLGIENHAEIHYAVVVKNLIYDALHYGKQVSRTAKLHREHKDIAGAEFLSGFQKEDRLKPVITLTLYFGSEDWDAPRSLFDMFETEHLINACTNSKIPVPQGAKEVNMSSGFERFVQHQREEAAAEAAAQAAAQAAIQASIEAWQDASFDREDILERLQKKYELDEATAAKYYEQYSVNAVV
jgi:hypothetical protein